MLDNFWPYLFTLATIPIVQLVLASVAWLVDVLLGALRSYHTARRARHPDCKASPKPGDRPLVAVGPYAGFSPDSNQLLEATRAFIDELTTLIQNRMDALVELHEHTLHEGWSVASGGGQSMGITEEAWSVIAQDALLLARRSQSRKADRIVQIAEADVRHLVTQYARQAEYDRAKANYAKEASMTTEQDPPERSYPLEPASPSFASTMPAHGLKLRSEASPEETRLLSSVELQRMQILAEDFLVKISTLSTEDIAQFIQDGGLQTTIHSQHVLDEARGQLSPEHFALFHAFSFGALNESLAALRGLHSLGYANIREIVASLPSYQQLPEEKQSFVQLIFGRLKK